MNKLFISLLVLLLFSQCANNSSNISVELTQIAEDINSKCPQMIDSETQLDGVEFKLPDTLTYKYTLIRLSALQADTHQFRLAMWPGLLSGIRVSSEMQKLRDNDIVIRYDYKDKNNRPFYLFTIAPKDYKQSNWVFMNKSDIEKILFLDIETVPLIYKYTELNDNAKDLWNKKWQYNKDISGEHQYAKAGIYAEFAKVAEQNPLAWSHGQPAASEEEIRTVTKKNRMICFPCKRFIKSFNASH